jgi:hypothetical protein
LASKPKIVFALTLLLSVQAWATLIETELFSVNVPDGWTCNPGESVFICMEDQAAGKRSAVIVINFSRARPQDTIEDFTRSLSVPRLRTTAANVQLRSRVISIENRQVNNKLWVHSTHFEGELPDYYTYYLGSRSDSHVFLITMSSHESEWEKNRKLFDAVIPTLHVHSVNLPTENAASDGQAISDTVGSIEVGKMPSPANGNASLAGGRITRSHIFLLVSVVVFGLVLLYALRS